MTTNIRTYSELITLPSLRERYEYLKLGDRIGKETFGFDRWLNQMFYTSDEWRSVRNKIILRDGGRELGMDGMQYEISNTVYIHHMNPLRKNDILDCTEYLTNPDYLICCSFKIHQDIHYGTYHERYEVVERRPYDTCPWKEG